MRLSLAKYARVSRPLLLFSERPHSTQGLRLLLGIVLWPMQVLFPIFKDDMWSLVVVDRRAKSITYLDASGGVGQEQVAFVHRSVVACRGQRRGRELTWLILHVF